MVLEPGPRPAPPTARPAVSACQASNSSVGSSTSSLPRGERPSSPAARAISRWHRRRGGRYVEQVRQRTEVSAGEPAGRVPASPAGGRSARPARPSGGRTRTPSPPPTLSTSDGDWRVAGLGGGGVAGRRLVALRLGEQPGHRPHRPQRRHVAPEQGELEQPVAAPPRRRRRRPSVDSRSSAVNAARLGASPERRPRARTRSSRCSACPTECRVVAREATWLKSVGGGNARSGRGRAVWRFRRHPGRAASA